MFDEKDAGNIKEILESQREIGQRNGKRIKQLKKTNKSIGIKQVFSLSRYTYMYENPTVNTRKCFKHF